LAYLPPGTFLSEQISHQQLDGSNFLSEQIGTSISQTQYFSLRTNQPPATSQQYFFSQYRSARAAVKYLIENESSSKLIHESIADLLRERRSES
jgi:hypothetical protein